MAAFQPRSVYHFSSSAGYRKGNIFLQIWWEIGQSISEIIPKSRSRLVGFRRSRPQLTPLMQRATGLLKQDA
jgi:hypothetical protein